ncbi:unnamed protein product [Citrullus colocynthis]|uniref:Uncharacterized protein n=1 Tax=Citrullus colocynthis TaxID=252529 RepID=A0ABP0XLP4_9ROSI
MLTLVLLRSTISNRISETMKRMTMEGILKMMVMTAEGISGTMKSPQLPPIAGEELPVGPSELEEPQKHSSPLDAQCHLYELWNGPLA